MQFQVNAIEFDFSDDIGDGDTMDDFLTDEYKQGVVDDMIAHVWEADDEDDLIEEITSASGYCIKSIDYLHVLMITSKTQMLNIMKQCDGADTLTREEKFQVFVNVCDNMLEQGRMTKATHKRFTEIW